MHHQYKQFAVAGESLTRLYTGKRGQQDGWKLDPKKDTGYIGDIIPGICEWVSEHLNRDVTVHERAMICLAFLDTSYYCVKPEIKEFLRQQLGETFSTIDIGFWITERENTYYVGDDKKQISANSVVLSPDRILRILLKIQNSKGNTK